MKRIMLLLLAPLLLLPAAARELKPVLLEPTNEIMHGKMIRSDLNGTVSALIRVQIPFEGVYFDGSLIGEPEYHINEYLVWIEAGQRMLKIQCPGAKSVMVDFADIGPETVQSSVVYRLDIDVIDHDINSKKETGVPEILTKLPPSAPAIPLNVAMNDNGKWYYCTPDTYKRLSEDLRENVIGLVISDKPTPRILLSGYVMTRNAVGCDSTSNDDTIHSWDIISEMPVSMKDELINRAKYNNILPTETEIQHLRLILPSLQEVLEKTDMMPIDTKRLHWCKIPGYSALRYSFIYKTMASETSDENGVIRGIITGDSPGKEIKLH